MKRIFSTLLIAAAVLSLTGCWKGNDSGDDYAAIRPGIELYGGAAYANDITLDALSMAMRLGLLLNEIDAVNEETPDAIVIGGKDDKQPDWSKLGKYKVDLEFTGKEDAEEDVRRKDILFGEDGHVKIWRDGDKYYIKYGNESNGRFTQAYIDNLFRYGTYVIDTKGVKLEASTKDNAWTVNAVDGEIKISTGYDTVAEYKCEFNNELTVYYDILDADKSEAKVFFFNVDNAEPNFASPKADSDWSMSGFVGIEDFDYEKEVFNMDDTFTKRFVVNVSSEGTPLGVPSMKLETVVPFDYRPLKSGFNKFNGYIMLTLDETTDYYTDQYVHVVFSNMGAMSLEYNNSSYED